jgi:hypothetical protein
MRTPESFKKPEALVDIHSSEKPREIATKQDRVNLEKISSERKKLEHDARFEALELAQSTSEKNTLSSVHIEKEEIQVKHISKKESFKKTMADARFEMSESQRLISKVIHNEIVEKVSDMAAKTIFRPYPILFGGIFALIFSLSIYIIAKNIGFELSGFETIFGFLAGWSLGIIFDYIRILVLGKNR